MKAYIEDEHKTECDVTFWVLMVMKIQIVVFCVVTLCSDVVGYQHVRGPCYFCLHHITTLHDSPENCSLKAVYICSV